MHAAHPPPGGPLQTTSTAANEALGLDQLYRRYAGVVLRRAMRFYPRADAEEVVHEVFLKVIETMDSFRGESSPSTWLWRITTRHCLNRLRDEGRRRDLLTEHHDAVPGVLGHHPDSEAQALLAQLWRTLDPDLVTIGVYAYVDGLSHDEIAPLVGVSARTVATRLQSLAEAARAVTSASSAPLRPATAQKEVAR